MNKIYIIFTVNSSFLNLFVLCHTCDEFPIRVIRATLLLRADVNSESACRPWGQRRWWQNCSRLPGLFPNDHCQEEPDEEEPAASQGRRRSIQGTAALSGVFGSRSWTLGGSWNRAPQPIHSYWLRRDHFLVQPSAFEHPVRVVLKEVGISCKTVQDSVRLRSGKMWNDQPECKQMKIADYC